MPSDCQLRVRSGRGQYAASGHPGRSPSSVFDQPGPGRSPVEKESRLLSQFLDRRRIGAVVLIALSRGAGIEIVIAHGFLPA